MSLRLAIPLVTSLVTFSLLGCGSDAGQGTTTLRPGVEDSSQSYKGTPSAAESAFWEAVRNGDDTGREEAANKMRAVARARGTAIESVSSGWDRWNAPMRRDSSCAYPIS